jgi:hypothetical protein
MNYYTTIILLGAVPVLFWFVFFVAVPRFRMERRARVLLSKHAGADRTSVYLPLHSTWAWEKQREIDARVAEMQSEGWIFLRGMEANPLRTICSWGGGLTLQFIREIHPLEVRNADCGIGTGRLVTL